MSALGESRRAIRTRCLALRSATCVTEQELITKAAAPGTARSSTRTPFAASRRAMTSESAWFSLQPRVRTEIVGVFWRDITRHHRTANAERETAGFRERMSRDVNYRSESSHRPGRRRSLRRGRAARRNQGSEWRGTGGVEAVSRPL